MSFFFFPFFCTWLTCLQKYCSTYFPTSLALVYVDPERSNACLLIWLSVTAVHIQLQNFDKHRNSDKHLICSPAHHTSTLFRSLRVRGYGGARQSPSLFALTPPSGAAAVPPPCRCSLPGPSLTQCWHESRCSQAAVLGTHTHTHTSPWTAYQLCVTIVH